MQQTKRSIALVAVIFCLIGARQSVGSDHWLVEAVDTSIEVGMYVSMKLERLGPHRAHISYYDHARKELKYAVQGLRIVKIDGTQILVRGPWIIERIDTGGEESALALDSNNIPHISYVDSITNTTKYATRVEKGGNCGQSEAQGKWQCTVVDRDRGQHTSIAIAPTGALPQMSYYRDDKLRHARRTPSGDGNCADGAWHCTDIDDSTATHTAIAVDSDDLGHIVYNKRGTTELAYARELPSPDFPPPGKETPRHCGREGSGWKWVCEPFLLGEQTIRTADGAAITLAPDGTRHVSAFFGGTGPGRGSNLLYARRNRTGPWIIGSVSTAGETDFVPTSRHSLRRSSIALDPLGDAYIGHQVCQPHQFLISKLDNLILNTCNWSPTLTNDRFLAYSKPTSFFERAGAWDTERTSIIDRIGNTGMFNAIAVRRDNLDPVIAYYDEQTRILKFGQHFLFATVDDE
jgi:hypothetical protein